MMNRPGNAQMAPAGSGIPQKRQKLSKKCSYTSWDCSGQALEGYSLCQKHILYDPTSPYKQCAFVYNTSAKRCFNPAPRMDRRDVAYCPEHTRKALIARMKSTSKGVLPENPERYLLNLKHYVGDKSGDRGKIKPLDPFAEIDASKANSSCCDILDYASSSDSDVEPTLASEALRGSFLDDSDSESLSSFNEDPLKHAGIYTAEEGIYIAREKLIKLQSLYIDQFKRLQYMLREKRRKYLHAIKTEKETLCSIYNQPKDTPKEKKIYDKLKALNGYHRKSGVEAILYRKSIERRVKCTEGLPHKPPSVPKCIFTEGGVKCGERTLPAAKHCRKHILKDERQVLFKACGAKRADIACHEPVPVVFDCNCVFHMDLPTPITLEPMKFVKDTQNSEPMGSDVHPMDIDVVSNNPEIDPEDDMAGLMREMSDPLQKKQSFNESITSETSTDTAFSMNAQCSDKDDSLVT
ncbi:KAT8 regulatory NSL complex subunit 2 [Fopius arisanus]|uniref:KAT8 regulatory NSL complex subunit 2 n=1 Tax=Fopius arisanus TaxID=64838 RepID=A0A9R1T2K6_9HYME|nr:PREDICTED: KAT8 regulatory NSL complex subunit 2 [Fopius arisanus]